MKSSGVVSAALIGVLAIHAVAQAQGGRSPRPSRLDRYGVTVWTTDDGLPQNSVNAIAQTPDGYLWLGTSGGLARFDGLRFTPVERRDSSGSHLDRIVAFAVGPDSALWIATENGLLRYHEGRFRVWREADGLPGRVVNGVHVDVDGTVWLMADGRLVRFADAAFSRVASTSGGWSVARDALGVLWYAPAPRGGLRGADTVALPSGAVAFVGEAGGERWFSARHGGLIRVGNRERRWTAQELGFGNATAVARDGAGDVWLASVTPGLHLLAPDATGRAAHLVPIPGGPAAYDVRSLFVDAEGAIWAGTNGDGLIRVVRKRFRVFSERDGLDKAQMTTVLEDRSGRMIFGTNCGGLFELPRGAESVRRFSWPGGARGPDCPTALLEARDGALWVGHYGPLYRLHRGTAEVVRTPNGASLSTVQALFEGRDGTVWAGMLHGGLVAIAPDGRTRRYRRADGLVNESVGFINEDAEGVIWVGTPGGLGRLADGRFTWFTMADGLPTENVRAIHQDAEGVHWIGTYGGGIARLLDGRFTAIRESHGLADNVVSTILADDDGNFWMTGNRGIQRVRRAELAAVADGALPRVHAVLYDRTDGLLSVETNGGFQPAAWRGRDGRFWFPTVRGVAVVDPVDAPIGAAPPRAVVEEILLDGTPAVSTEEIVIGPGRRGLEVRYTGLNLTAPQHVAFRYLLHGFDSEWALVGTRRAAIYPRLPPGRYRFEVQAANRDGTWGAAAIVPIRALPFAWETTWFRLLVLMTTLAAVAWAVRRRFALLELRAEHQRAFARRFIEGQETERQRIAAELHDSVGQGLLVAKNRATIALMRTDLGPETRAHLDEIASVMMETLETTREISHNLRPHELDQFGLGTAVRAAVERASSPTTQIAADVDSVDGLLGSDAEIAVYRIVQEAVNNVLKHSGATHARVSLRRDALGVRLLVADNGDGFAMDGTRPGFGLAGIAQRAALHGGRCDVQSAPGSGTTVVVTIPVTSDATIPVAIPDAAPATVPGS